MRRAAWAVLSGLLCSALVACGGTDFNAATTPTTRPHASPTRRPATITTSSTLSQIERASRPAFIRLEKEGLGRLLFGAGIGDAQLECVATAIVDSIGIRRLLDLRITSFRLLNSPLPLPLSVGGVMNRADRVRLGSALQACHFGAIYAAVLAEGDPPSITSADVACMAQKLDNPARRMLLADSVLYASLDDPDALGLATTFFGCVSFAKIVGAASGVTFSTVEASCIDERMRANSVITRAIADAMRNRQPDEQAAALAVSGVFSACATPNHLRQLAGLPPPILSV